MKRSGDQALDQALEFHRSPGFLGAIRRLDLPKDLQTVLRIAAGDSETIVQSAQLTNESPESLREVSIFYLQQLLFADEGDSYRVLGVNPDAPDEQIKLNYRWLARWLHPDRNPDEWESVFAERVNQAWQDLRTPTLRNAFDLKRAAEIEDSPDRLRAGSLVPVRTMIPTPPVGAGTVRWLPTIIVSSLGLFAVVALGVMYKIQVMDRESNAAEVELIPHDIARSESPPVAPVLSNALSESAAPQAIPPNEAPINPAPVAVPVPVSVPVPVPVASAAPAAVAVATSSPPLPMPVAAQAELAEAPLQTPVMKPTPKQLNSLAPVRPAVRKETAGNEIAAPAVVAAANLSEAANQMSSRVASRPAIAASNQTQAPAPAPALAQVQAQAPKTILPDNTAAATTQPTLNTVAIRTYQSQRNLIDDRIAASLVSRFSQAYANGDMDRLMQLFTHDAQNGRGDRQAIAEDYRRLFEASERRRIALSDLSWLTIGDGAAIIASFETEVVPRGKTHGEHASGDIRFDLREEDGELRIYRLSHDNRRS